MSIHGSSEGSSANAQQLDQRQQLERMFHETPLPPDHLMFNLGMYTRSSVLVKFLFMNDIYQRVENLRAIHEPFNKQRIIVGFDTFSGYRRFTDKDVRGDVMGDGTYATPPGYRDYLAALLEAHEGANAFGHQRGNHRLIEGDATLTVPKYFSDHPETIVAMAFFDIGTYLPTVEALKAMKSSLIPGSVLVFDELTWPGAPGEAIAFKEVFRDIPYRIEKSVLYPSKAIVTVG
jgi:hypothetical protein